MILLLLLLATDSSGFQVTTWKDLIIFVVAGGEDYYNIYAKKVTSPSTGNGERIQRLVFANAQVKMSKFLVKNDELHLVVVSTLTDKGKVR